MFRHGLSLLLIRKYRVILKLLGDAPCLAMASEELTKTTVRQLGKRWNSKQAGYNNTQCECDACCEAFFIQMLREGM